MECWSDSARLILCLKGITVLRMEMLDGNLDISRDLPILSKISLYFSIHLLKILTLSLQHHSKVEQVETN